MIVPVVERGEESDDELFDKDVGWGRVLLEARG